MVQNPWRPALAVLMLLSLASLAAAAAVASDVSNVAVPVYGTSKNQDVTGRMQQYVGFYGNVAMEVRNNTSAGNVMYNKSVNSGKLYFAKNGATLSAPFAAAANNSVTDGNFSLSGWYATINHYSSTGTICGVSSAAYLTTTDGYNSTILKDNTADPAKNYFLCVDLASKTSSNGFGSVTYEIVVPTTATYTAYDIWYDLA